jgi:hypothetical protein
LLADLIYMQQQLMEEKKKKKKKNNIDSFEDNFDFMDRPTEKGKFYWKDNCQFINQINNNVDMSNAEDERSVTTTFNIRENGNIPITKENNNGFVNNNINGKISIGRINFIPTNITKDNNNSNNSVLPINEINKINCIAPNRSLIQNEFFSKDANNTANNNNLSSNSNKSLIPFKSTGSILKNSIKFFKTIKVLQVIDLHQLLKECSLQEMNL